jgi:chromosome segregation ATPase
LYAYFTPKAEVKVDAPAHVGIVPLDQPAVIMTDAQHDKLKADKKEAEELAKLCEDTLKEVEVELAKVTKQRDNARDVAKDRKGQISVLEGKLAYQKSITEQVRSPRQEEIDAEVAVAVRNALNSHSNRQWKAKVTRYEEQRHVLARCLAIMGRYMKPLGWARTPVSTQSLAGKKVTYDWESLSALLRDEAKNVNHLPQAIRALTEEEL